MTSAKIVRAQNINDAYAVMLAHVRNVMEYKPDSWRLIAPRGMTTLEYDGIVITEYERPMERVLFDSVRDANPFFHFFESLWILAGRSDVEFLARFNKNMTQFSDDGRTYHAPYGWRLRKAFLKDQVNEVIEMLRRDPNSRQAVLQIWIADEDLNVKSKDIPCNDMIFLKIREGRLNMTVCCRSNDMIWGAYGANVVQFSVLQEYIARCIGCEIGTYSQVSDSFHVYVERDDVKRLLTTPSEYYDPYAQETVKPHPLFISSSRAEWDYDMYEFFKNWKYADSNAMRFKTSFWQYVVKPLYIAWDFWYRGRDEARQEAYALAARAVMQCEATDWRLACLNWLERRVTTTTEAIQ